MDDARAAAERALAEDLAGYGDITGRVFEGPGRARVEAREEGVLSGSGPFLAAARLVDPDLIVEFALRDGDRFAADESVCRLEGRFASLLALERTGVNFLARLSGVATLTARFVAETAGTKARIVGTRKTTPGLRALERAAMAHGGAVPHRFGLFDGAMIKDNHIAAAGGVREAVTLVRAGLSHAHGLIVEVEDLAQLDEALACAVPAVLLDNMDLETVRAAVARVAGRAVVEVSGGVRLEDVRPLAQVGVDIISVGALTTQARWVDLSMEAEAVR